MSAGVLKKDLLTGITGQDLHPVTQMSVLAVSDGGVSGHDGVGEP